MERDRNTSARERAEDPLLRWYAEQVLALAQTARAQALAQGQAPLAALYDEISDHARRALALIARAPAS